MVSKSTTLPLHAPTVDTLDLTRLHAAAGAALDIPMSLLEGRSLPRTCPNTLVPPETRLSRKDMQVAEKAGIIRRIHASEARAWGTMFTVLEPSKNRRRLIYWPRWLNDNVTLRTLS